VEHLRGGPSVEFHQVALVEAADDRGLVRLVARYGRLGLLLLDDLATSRSTRAALSYSSRSSPNGKKEPRSRSGKPPVQQWGTAFPAPRLVAAIAGRVTFNAHVPRVGRPRPAGGS
jgi:hypothetical protein